MLMRPSDLVNPSLLQFRNIPSAKVLQYLPVAPLGPAAKALHLHLWIMDNTWYNGQHLVSIYSHILLYVFQNLLYGYFLHWDYIHQSHIEDVVSNLQ